MNYETIIGLEIHAQLLTESKMFCTCSAKFGDRPNTNICPICTGQPGVLPKMNRKAIELAIRTALALKSNIEPRSVFARKNYFYPDLPKNYQISQYELPLATKGYLDIEMGGQTKKIGITRVHLEEDAGKLVHKGAARIMGASESLVDLNRTGTPLMEIVSEPDIRSPEEAKEYVEELANLLKQLGVCDAKLEEGSLRCDANISLRPVGETKLGVKSEIKNLNSFRSILKALEYEVKRQTQLLNEGGKVVQETRYFDDLTDTTTSMRSKEFAHDYRYFPEPDLVPVEPDPKWVDEIKKTVGELPSEKRKKYQEKYKLSAHNANVITASKEMEDFFEETLKYENDALEISNMLVGDVSAWCNENKTNIAASHLTPLIFAGTIGAIHTGKISKKIAKDVIVEQLKTGKSVDEITKASGMTQISDEGELLKAVKEAIAANPDIVENYKKGKTGGASFLVGQIMKATKGRANPGLVNKLLAEELKK